MLELSSSNPYNDAYRYEQSRVELIQKEHRDLLCGLHQEIDKLQKQNFELTQMLFQQGKIEPHDFDVSTHSDQTLILELRLEMERLIADCRAKDDQIHTLKDFLCKQGNKATINSDNLRVLNKQKNGALTYSSASTISTDIASLSISAPVSNIVPNQSKHSAVVNAKTTKPIFKNGVAKSNGANATNSNVRPTGIQYSSTGVSNRNVALKSKECKPIEKKSNGVKPGVEKLTVSFRPVLKSVVPKTAVGPTTKASTKVVPLLKSCKDTV